MAEGIYGFTSKGLQGEEISLEQYKGKLLLVVNTASNCGFTPQYSGLEELYQKYKDAGLVILGFPCNQFGHQEPGSSEDIGEFCQKNYGVTFQMFQKVDVNGDTIWTKTYGGSDSEAGFSVQETNDGGYIVTGYGAASIFKFLKNQAPGILGTEKIKWNFTKFLVDQQGKVLKRYAPKDTPAQIEKDISSLLG